MGKAFANLQDQRFIGEQHRFFAATAVPDGRVNPSPNRMGTLRILSPVRSLWPNLGISADFGGDFAPDPFSNPTESPA